MNEQQTGTGGADRVRAAGEDLREDAQVAGETVGRHARDLSSEARGEAASAVEAGRRRARDGLEAGRSRVAEEIGDVSDALHTAARELRSREREQASSYADWAASVLEGAASHLGGREVPDLVAELRGVARREPALFIGGAAAGGFLLARFLKSSERGRGEPDAPAVAPGAAGRTQEPF